MDDIQRYDFWHREMDAYLAEIKEAIKEEDNQEEEE